MMKYFPWTKSCTAMSTGLSVRIIPSSSAFWAICRARLAKAREEIPHAKDYDYIVYNDALEDAVSDLRAIIKAEKLKFSRNTNSIERVLEDAETVR